MQRTDGDRQRRQGIADVSSGHRPRLLPWTTGDGKRCLLSSDGEGFLSRLADDFEAVQLTMAEDMLKAARKVLDDPMSPHVEVRYAGIRLAECLTDVVRVAESRGLRLSSPDSSDDEDGDDEDPAAPSEVAG
ncbi:hypothetical protein [Streptomyces sp. NPDC056405]|uniref:hypothetical protein n=1 Tax=Streptomyces sp. NPDC056405 TaxID=3345811 RepID=UPI0035DFBD04